MSTSPCGRGTSHCCCERGPPGFSSANTVDSARANLASSLVNGFVNAGFGQDKLLTNDGNKWLYKNKGYGMMSATASLGLVLLWDVEGGLTQIDKFLYSTEDYIKVCHPSLDLTPYPLPSSSHSPSHFPLNSTSPPLHPTSPPTPSPSHSPPPQSGALLACGIVNCGVRNECDPALALLSDYVVHQSNTMRLGAIIGYVRGTRDCIRGAVNHLSPLPSPPSLVLAYAGSAREDVIQLLTPVLLDSSCVLPW